MIENVGNLAQDLGRLGSDFILEATKNNIMIVNVGVLMNRFFTLGIDQKVDRVEWLQVVAGGLTPDNRFKSCTSIMKWRFRAGSRIEVVRI